MEASQNTPTYGPQTTVPYKGYVADPVQGIVYNKNGKPMGSVSKSTGYVYLTVEWKHYAAHRFIYEAAYGVQLTRDQHINHINHVKTDNRIVNLEVVTNQQNVQWGVARTGEYKGVNWNKGKKKWRAELKYNEKAYGLGYYKTAIEAAKAYNDFAMFLNQTEDCKYFLNTIDEPDYKPNPRNVPADNATKFQQNKTCSQWMGVVFNKRRNHFVGQIKYKRKSYYLGCNEKAVECAKLYNIQASFFNSQGANPPFVLNDIPDYVTVPKDIFTERVAKNKSKKSSKYIGVSMNKKSGKWQAALTYNKKQVHIGFFDDEQSAATAYNKKAKELNEEIGKVVYKLNVL